MHWHHVFLGQQEVLHREHRLFHFAGVAHARDQHFTLPKMNNHGRIRVGAIALGVTHEIGNVKDFPLGFVDRVIRVGANEHVAPEQRLPCGCGGHFDRQVVVAVLTDMQMLHPCL